MGSAAVCWSRAFARVAEGAPEDSLSAKAGGVPKRDWSVHKVLEQSIECADGLKRMDMYIISTTSTDIATRKGLVSVLDVRPSRIEKV